MFTVSFLFVLCRWCQTYHAVTESQQMWTWQNNVWIVRMFSPFFLSYAGNVRLVTVRQRASTRRPVRCSMQRVPSGQVYAGVVGHTYWWGQFCWRFSSPAQPIVCVVVAYLGLLAFYIGSLTFQTCPKWRHGIWMTKSTKKDSYKCYCSVWFLVFWSATPS